MCYFIFNTLCRPACSLILNNKKTAPCADLKSFVRAINLECFVTNINGPSSARQRNAIEMAFCWRADDAGDPDQDCEETLHFCAFSGVGGSCPPVPPSPSGSAHAPQNKEIILILIDRPLARNLSSGLELRGFRPCQTRIKLLR